jgi:ligand-binding sensor domain-containing protein
MQVEEESDGNLLVLLYQGLIRYVPATGVLTRLGSLAATDTSCRCFLKQANGTIYVASREGLWRYSGTQWEPIEKVPQGDPQCPERIVPADNGDFWIPWSDQGPPRLAWFRAGRSEFLDLSQLPDYPITEFLQDHEGHLWIGTESGLCQLRPNAVRVYAREQGLRNDEVKSVTEGPDGAIWLGTAEGLSGIKDGQVTNLPPVEPPSNWGLPEGLLADRRGRVWYGVQRNSVMAFDHGAWTSPAPLSLGESWVRTLYEDRQGRIWAGFDRGVAWINEAGKVQALPYSLSNPDVRIIHEDRRGDFWFGTFGGGLNHLHEGQIIAYVTPLGEYNNRFFTFTTRHGLRENIINNIQEDDFGYLWLSGPQGIYRVARRDLNEVAAGRRAQAQVIAFGESDGLLNSQCNGGVNQPSGVKDRAGRIWFPTARGVAMIDPRTIRRNTVPPPATIMVSGVRRRRNSRSHWSRISGRRGCSMSWPVPG